jgi:hypothetical protein
MKKILPVAVLAALAGVNSAQAVHVNPDGTGQVLVFPFYTVESGQNTYINMVNTTEDYKAVKVRVLESMNSVEVLDFNLYLSPHDHWSAVIQADAGGGASLKSNDNSCTVPLAVSQGVNIPFRKFEYTNDSVNGIERTREGYVEMIEMGTVTDSTYQAAILHGADGIPGNCNALDKLWAANGTWTNDPSDGVSGLSGGLYGYGVLIDVAKGADAGYDAVAIDDWHSKGDVHSNPGSLFPSITSQADDTYEVFDSGGVVAGEAFTGADAVTATLMMATLSNDYVLDKGILAGTDWVVTFPTKREYVNGEGAPYSPFTNAWDPKTSTACESFELVYWNREEATASSSPSDFSPQPPPGESAAFCAEANVLTFNDSKVLDASARTGLDVTLQDGFENGWARIDFRAEGRYLDTFDHTFAGLPAVGFAVQRYVDENVTDGVLGTYAGNDLHKGSRDITSVVAQ